MDVTVAARDQCIREPRRSERLYTPIECEEDGPVAEGRIRRALRGTKRPVQVPARRATGCPGWRTPGWVELHGRVHERRGLHSSTGGEGRTFTTDDSA
jgi:hypothetical protein